MDHNQLSEIMRVPKTWRDIPGYFDFEEFYQFIVAQAPPNALLVEVGNFLGRSVCYLGQLAKEADKGLKIIAVDRCTGSSSDSAGVGLAATLGGSYAGILARNIQACGLSDVISLVVADSADAAEVVGGDQGVPSVSGPPWFVFLDADHSYEGLKRDLLAWRRLQPTILAGHDFFHDDFPGVKQAVLSVVGEVSTMGTCWWTATALSPRGFS